MLYGTPQDMLESYALTSVGWEADPFLQEIAAYPKPPLLPRDRSAAALQRLALATLDLAGGGFALSHDLLDMIGTYTSPVAAKQRFRARAAAAGGFLHEGEWTGRRAEPA
jgi:hypothetical protein